MNITAENIVNQALDLPIQVRAFVAEKIIESLDATQNLELSPSWWEEIQKRCREMDQGLVKLCDSKDVFAKACKSICWVQDKNFPLSSHL